MPAPNGVAGRTLVASVSDGRTCSPRVFSWITRSRSTLTDRATAAASSSTAHRREVEAGYVLQSLLHLPGAAGGIRVQLGPIHVDERRSALAGRSYPFAQVSRDLLERDKLSVEPLDVFNRLRIDWRVLQLVGLSNLLPHGLQLLLELLDLLLGLAGVERGLDWNSDAATHITPRPAVCGCWPAACRRSGLRAQ